MVGSTSAFGSRRQAGTSRPLAWVLGPSVRSPRRRDLAELQRGGSTTEPRLHCWHLIDENWRRPPPTMSSWEKLAEARIQAWLRAPQPGRPRPTDDGLNVPLETQLLDEALELAREVSELPEGPQREATLRQGVAIETRLLILLERSGRPLAAARIGELLVQVRARLATSR